MTTYEASFKRLFRANSDRVIGGVCGGLGDYLNVDPVIIRVIWLATILIGGTGILAYLIAWILIPVSPEGYQTQYESKGRSAGGSRILGAVIIVLAIILLGVQLQYIPYFPWEWIWPIGLIALGIAVLLRPKIISTSEQMNAGEVSRGQETETTSDTSGTYAPGPTVDYEYTENQKASSDTRLKRSRTDRVIFGVCGGLANHFQVDAVLLRLLWTLAALFSIGFFVIAYLIMTFIMPEED